jgi:hypothetical protein
MTRAQRIVTALADANRATRELGADLNELRLSREIERDDDTSGDHTDTGDASDKCECPCSACIAGRCADCVKSPCDEPACAHRSGDDDDD